MTSHPIRPLTVKQERRLRDFLDDKFLDISRNYRKRSELSTKLPTLTAYLDATRPVLALILQIPPVAPSMSLRTAFLMRLTNDALTAVTGYAIQSEEELEALVDWLDDFDRAWVVLIKGQLWDPNKQKRHDGALEDDSDEDDMDGMDVDSGPASATGISSGLAPASSPNSTKTISQTERTRLRSLILSFSSSLEDWLALLEAPPSTTASSDDVVRDSASNESEDIAETTSAPGPASSSADMQSVLKRLSLQNAFNDLFSGTMSVLGDLGGVVLEAGEEAKVC
ncbi:hypothetical protein BDV98DRAFT_545841 [Pterulicium gracile]|uniref:Uncharacterized protein n=1 Tax=Pterulicium gracile TaxID=1884261 RepID=A0A5C3QS87_9AGAR|nr:hypothetical protein BDV98DRAFT_545841 [Pterula gracilis]